MPNINLATRYDPDAAADPLRFVDLTQQYKRTDNAPFLAEVARRMRELGQGSEAKYFDGSGLMSIGLMGEYGLIGYGIRRAQEVLRVDRTPSHWSHAFLVAAPLTEEAKELRARRSAPWILESTLEPSDNLNSWVMRDGVGPRRISDYVRSDFDLFSQHCVPNMAVVAIGMSPEERKLVLERANDPAVDRLHYDIPGLLGAWFAYLTNQANQSNPLANGRAVFCSAYVQLAYDASGIDLSPGAHQRNTAPEHLWQAAKYLHSTFRTTETSQIVRRPVYCWYVVRDPYCLIAPVGKPEQDLPRDFVTLLNRTK